MIAGADVYEYAASTFIQQIRLDCPPAAGYLEQIQANYGPYPAFLAAFALTILKDRREHQRIVSSYEALKTFAYYDEMRETSEAIQLYQEAAKHLLSL